MQNGSQANGSKTSGRTKRSSWETVLLARHPERPQSRDYIELMCKDFCELHGDRRFGDDEAIVTGFARIKSIDRKSVV